MGRGHRPGYSFRELLTSPVNVTIFANAIWQADHTELFRGPQRNKNHHRRYQGSSQNLSKAETITVLIAGELPSERLPTFAAPRVSTADFEDSRSVVHEIEIGNESFRGQEYEEERG
jgi:hypothetical protein